MQRAADLFESFDFIGPNYKSIETIISNLKIDETKCFQEMGKIKPQTHYKLGFSNCDIGESNQYNCICEKQDCGICSSNYSRNSFIFPDGLCYSIYMFDGEKPIPQDVLQRVKSSCRKGQEMKDNFHTRRDGLFFANNKRDNPIFERKNYKQTGLVEKLNSTQKLFFVGQRQEDFLFREFDNIQVDEMKLSNKFNGSYKKIHIIIFFQVAYVFCTIFPILSLFETILYKFQHYISNKRNYFVKEQFIHQNDYKHILNYIILNKSLNNAFISLKQIKPDVDKYIECSQKCEFQIGKYHIHKDLSPLSKWIYVNMFKYVPLESLLCLIAAVLTEQNLFICSQNITLLTSFMIGLEYLLKPLDYQSQYIYCLPQSFLEEFKLEDIPIPVVYGIHSSYDKFMLITKGDNSMKDLSFVFDLDFKTLYTSDKNKLQIKKETDFITSSYLNDLNKLFLQLQPHTKNKSFFKKVKHLFQPHKKHAEEYQSMLKQFTLNFEFTAEEYTVSDKIIEVFQTILENDIIQQVREDLLRKRNLSHEVEGVASKIDKTQVNRSISDNNQYRRRSGSNFYQHFKGTQIFQSIINEDQSSFNNNNLNNNNE